MDKVSQKKIVRVSLYRRRLKIEAAGSLKKGYNITSLIATIDKFLDPPRRENVIIAGAGNLGMALLTFFTKNR